MNRGGKNTASKFRCMQFDANQENKPQYVSMLQFFYITLSSFNHRQSFSSFFKQKPC